MQRLFPYLIASVIALLLAAGAFAQDTAEDLYARGVELMKSGKVKDAIPLFDQALTLNANYVEALLSRSRARVNNQDDLKGALDDLNTALQLSPFNGEAYFRRAQILDTMINLMVRDKGGMSSTELRPYWEGVLKDVNSAIEHGFANKESFSFRAGYYSRNLQNEAAAIDDYTRAIQYDPFDIQLLLSRAHARRSNDDLEGAEKDFLTVVSRYENLKADGKADKESLMELKDAAVMALNNLSSVYALGEKPDKQMWAIEKSIDLDPTHVAYISLARHKMIYGSLDESLAFYTKAIEMSKGKIGRYYMDRGVVHLLKDNAAEAKADFEMGKKIEPGLERYNLKYWLELAKRQREQRTVKVELPNGS